MPIEYPKRFDVCPNCGSMVRIIEAESREQASKGKTGIEAKFGCFMTKTAIFDPTKTAIIAPKKFPIILARYDVCADCGTFYCVEVVKEEATATPHFRRDDFQAMPPT